MASIIRRGGSHILSLIESGADPAAVANAIELYAKDSAGITQLFARSSDGTVHQLTPPSGSSAFSGASVYSSVAIATANSTMTLLTCNTEVFDVGGYHDNAVNNSRLTAPTTGYYYVVAAVAFQNTSGTGARLVSIRKNAAGSGAGGTALGSFQMPSTISGTTPVIEVSRIVQLNAGDYVEAFALQSSGGALDVNMAEATPFQIMRIGA